MRGAGLALLAAGAAAMPSRGGDASQCPYRRRLRSGAVQQQTIRNCTCTSACGATVDFDQSAWDWCYTEGNCGSQAVSRGFKYYDYCVYPPDDAYEGQTADAKMKSLWADITKDQSGGTYPNQAGLLLESVKTTFENYADVFPSGRKKYIHSVGSVCKASFKAVPGSKYTGVFQGHNNIIIRFSSASDIDPKAPLMQPGFGIKFLLDGRQSANFVSMPSLHGQESFNFFSRNYTNHPPHPPDAKLVPVGLKFDQASNCPLHVGLSHSASWTADGKRVATPVFPFLLVWKPTGKVAFPDAPYERSTLTDLFRKIPAGTHIFEAHSYDSPTATTTNPVGDLYIESDGCVPSTFGDEQLFFKHDYSEDDFALRPDWLAAVKARKDVNDYCGIQAPHTATPGTVPPNPEPRNG